MPRPSLINCNFRWFATPPGRRGNSANQCGRRRQASVTPAEDRGPPCKAVTKVWLLFMVPGLAYGQTATQSANSSSNTSDVRIQLDALRQALSQTQQQVAAQQQEIQTLKAQLKGGQSAYRRRRVRAAVEVVPPNRRCSNANPQTLSPEIHDGVAGASKGDRLHHRRNRMNSNLR